MTTPERVLITGGASGIGAATAARCRAAGWEPVIIDRVGNGIRADLSSPDDTARALAEALAGGPITRLVNNVGVVVPNDAEHQTLAEFDLALSVNLRCAFQCMQALLPGMKAAGFGRIVNMSSRAALGKELRTAYSATKAGLIGMTRVWALELGAHGINVNAVCPNHVTTGLGAWQNEYFAAKTGRTVEQYLADMRARIPLGRPGLPTDTAAAVAYLCSDDAVYVTGEAINVSGGEENH